MGGSTDSVGRHLERVARREVAVVDQGVAFAFGAAEPSATEVLKLSERFEQIRDDIVGTNKPLLIVSEASSPGEDDFNQALSEQRGEWLKGWLVEQGVDPNQIEIKALGESDADQVGDSAYDRVAIWQVEDVSDASTIATSDLVTTLRERWPVVADDRAAGERKFFDAIGPSADSIRELHALPENPVFPDPSADPVHFLKQAGELAWDFFAPPTTVEEVGLEGIANKGEVPDVKGLLMPGPLEIAEGAAGVAVGVARDNMTGDVADARRPLFKALEEATAAALDRNHELNLEGMDARSRVLATALYNRLVILPDLDRYQIAIFLAEAYRSSIDWLGPPEKSFLEGKLDGTTFGRGADFIFSDSDYSYRSNDPGIRSLFGHKFEKVDGQLRLVDVSGQVIAATDAQASPGFDMEADAAQRGFDVATLGAEGMYDMRPDMDGPAPDTDGSPPQEPPPEEASPGFNMEIEANERGFNMETEAAERGFDVGVLAADGMYELAPSPQVSPGSKMEDEADEQRSKMEAEADERRSKMEAEADEADSNKKAEADERGFNMETEAAERGFDVGVLAAEGMYDMRPDMDGPAPNTAGSPQEPPPEQPVDVDGSGACAGAGG